MYAIVKTGGKQYKVVEGGLIVVEKLEGEPDATIELTEVLMVGGDDVEMRVGAPRLTDVKVVAKVVSQGKGKKIEGFTYKAKKSIHHHYGHRQHETRLRIESITVGA